MLNLKALLTKILTQITPTDFVTSSGCVLRQVGRTVFISGAVTGVTSTAGVYNNWFTVPEQFRPSAARYIPCFLGGNANVPALIRVETSGQVSLFCYSTNSSTSLWLSSCYIL